MSVYCCRTTCFTSVSSPVCSISCTQSPPDSKSSYPACLPLDTKSSRSGHSVAIAVKTIRTRHYTPRGRKGSKPTLHTTPPQQHRTSNTCNDCQALAIFIFTSDVRYGHNMNLLFNTPFSINQSRCSRHNKLVFAQPQERQDTAAILLTITSDRYCSLSAQSTSPLTARPCPALPAKTTLSLHVLGRQICGASRYCFSHWCSGSLEETGYSGCYDLWICWEGAHHPRSSGSSARSAQPKAPYTPRRLRNTTRSTCAALQL